MITLLCLNKKELENMHLSSFENNEGIKQFKKIKLKLFNSISKYQSFIMYIGRPTCPDCRSFENESYQSILQGFNI